MCSTQMDLNLLSFMKNLKATVSPQEFDIFCNALADFSHRRICAADLIATANGIFLGDKDLISGFNSFLPEEYRIKPSSHGQYNWFDVKKASVDFFNEIRRIYSDDHDETYRSFLGIMKRYDLGDVGVKKVHEEVDALFKDNPALYIEFTRLFADFKEDPKQKKHHNNHKEEDFKEDPQRQKRKRHHEDEDDEGVIIKGSYCSRKKRNCSYEVKLFEWEDRIFELDMFRGYLESTISQAEKFLGEYYCRRSDKSCWDMKEYFGMKEIVCIVYLYGEAGEDMVELLWSDPVNVLQRLLPRLRQKLTESIEFLQDGA